MNNKILTALVAVLLVAVIALFVMHFTCGKAACHKQGNTAVATQGSDFSIAYINSDSLLLHYELYKKLKAEMEDKQSRAEKQYEAQMRDLEKDAYEYQNKAQKGLLTRTEMLETEQGLQARQQQLQQFEQKLTADLQKEEQSRNQMINDSIKAVIKEFNADKKYRMILNNGFGSTVVDADSTLNITDTILVLINERYKKYAK